MTTIGIVGRGFVGTAVAKGFAQFEETKIYDIDPRRATHDFKEVINCDFVFLCLPTPMVDAKGGSADLTILENCIKKIFEIEDRNPHTIFIIKSTVPVGTTERLCNQNATHYIVHCPEFLTARSALIDFICPARNIVGYVNATIGLKVKGLLQRRFPGTPCYTMRASESEMVKYVANCFFATKVMFFNEMRLITDELGLDWDRILEGVMSDGRIGTSHYQVPGHDGDVGFGGTCVLPDAEVYMGIYDNGEEINFGVDSIENLHEAFINKNSSKAFTIESCNSGIERVEEKFVSNVTVREIDEEIYCFQTDRGEFCCTEDHLMPVWRGDEIIIIKAKEIKDTDQFFSK